MEQTAPKIFTETVLLKVTPGERLAVNFRKKDNTITLVDRVSPLINRVCVGDKFVAVNGKKFEFDELNRLLQDKKTKQLLIDFEHACFSWCRLKMTTVERMSIDKDSEKSTGRAVNIYEVVIHDGASDSTDQLDKPTLGLGIKYDARERIQVATVLPDSLAAVHLRPGDVIKEVNGKVYVSKAMMTLAIMQSFVDHRRVTFTIECSVEGGDAYRDSIEMPFDVVEIAKKQVDFLKSGQFKAATVPIMVTGKTETKKKVSISTKESKEISIVSDYDPSKLKPCKQANK